jgi:hypothetical protein
LLSGSRPRRLAAILHQLPTLLSAVSGLFTVRVKSQSYFTTGDLPPIRSSWRQAPWDPRPVIFFPTEQSVARNCCPPLLAKSFSGPSPAGLMTIFYRIRFDTSPTWRATSPYLLYIAQEQCGPVIPPGAEFPFRRLLSAGPRHTGSAWTAQKTSFPTVAPLLRVSLTPQFLLSANTSWTSGRYSCPCAMKTYVGVDVQIHKPQMPLAGHCVHGAKNVAITQKDQPLLSSKRRPPISKHINGLGKHIILVMGPETKNECAGEGQRQSTGPGPRRLVLPRNCCYTYHHNRQPLWSSGQSSWLQIQRTRVRPDFLRSSGSGTGSSQPCEDNRGAT